MSKQLTENDWLLIMRQVVGDVESEDVDALQRMLKRLPIPILRGYIGEDETIWGIWNQAEELHACLTTFTDSEIIACKPTFIKKVERIMSALEKYNE